MRRARVGVAAVTAIVALGACGSTTTTSGDTTTVEAATTTTPTTVAPTTAAPSTASATGAGATDKGFRLESVTFADDGLGDFGGTARVTNTKTTSRTGSFTVTVLGPTKAVIASLEGTATGVAASQTVTVQLVSSDKFKALGPHTVEFQTNVVF